MKYAATLVLGTAMFISSTATSLECPVEGDSCWPPLSPIPEATLQLLAKNEISAFAIFYQDWLNGQVPKSDFHFRLNQNILSPNFKFVTPDGSILTKSNVGPALMDQHGSNPHLIKIEDKNVTVIFENEERVILMYDEHHIQQNQTTILTTTAEFEKWPDAPEGVRWVWIRETIK